MRSAPASWDWDEGPSLLGSAWRYRWLLVAAVLVGALLGLGLSSLQPTRYEGVARVLLLDREPGQEPGTVDPARELQNQVNVMTSASVLGQASERHGGGQTVEELRELVTVEASRDADVITIRALDPAPAGAARLADSVASAYEEVVAQDVRRQATDAIAASTVEEARLRRQLDQLEAARAAAPGNTALRVEAETVTSQLQSVLTEQLRLHQEANRPTGAGVALRERAAVPTEPAQPKRLRNTAGGALLLLFAAAGLAWTLAGRRTAASPRRPPIAASTTRPPPPEIGGNGSQPPLTPELIVAFDRLAKPLQEVVETLRLDGWSVTEQSLPQVEAEKAARHFGLDVAAILLDDGQGRLQVVGEVGLTPRERRAAIGHDPAAWREVFDGGPRLVEEQDRPRFAEAGIPVGAGETVLLVPLVHDDIGFGLLVARARGNAKGGAGFEQRDVESVTAYARVIAPTLWSWVLLDRLKLRLGQER